MDKKLNPLDGEIDLLGDTVSDIVRKLNPLTGRLELVYKADSYIQKINPFIGDFDIVGGAGASYIIKEATGNGYINLTNAVANHLIELKAYGGTEQRNLPKGYTQYEYLRSSGTQYIDLGYKGNGNTKVEIKFKYHTETSATGSGRVFGSRTSSSSNAFAIGTSSGIVSSTSNKVFWCYDAQSFYVVDDVVFGLDEWKTVIFSATEHKVDDTTYGDDYNITTFETPSNLMLFAFDNNGTVGVGYVDIAYCKLWDNGVLVRDLIPCKDSSNVIGMYDLVTGNLLTNVGTGTFETGNTATPTPTTPVDIVTNNGVLKARHQSGLPLGYTLLDYIVFDSTQMIDTGFTPDNNSRIESKCYRTGEDCWFYGASPSNPRITLYHSRTGTSRWGNQSISSIGLVADTEYTFIEDKNGLSINGTLYPWASGTAGDFTCDRSLTIGNNNGSSGTRYFAGNLYYMKIYNNNVLVRNFVPCQNSSNVVGLYDTVNGVFYTETGLVAGNTVSDPIEIYTDGTTETIEDELGNIATAEMLLKVGDYADEQEILSGDITRKVGIKVLDGTENWQNISSYYNISKTAIGADSVVLPAASTDIICTHYETISGVPNRTSVNVGGSYINFRDDNISTLANWKQRLADQYNAGTPVIVICPLATPTTETATGQAMNIQAGSNTIEITQASIDNLGLYAKYKATA